jgi:mono/diheme cytochrome c family protein
MSARLRNVAKIVVLTGIGLIAVLQLVPYGRDHTNPAATREPEWDRPATRVLAVRACFDCHSNETRWPWYSHLAPFSWLVQRDVDVGRRVLNFSEWDRPYEEAGESAKTVLEGEMPPAMYLPLHPSARLSAEEKRSLANGLVANVGSQTGEAERD